MKIITEKHAQQELIQIKWYIAQDSEFYANKTVNEINKIYLTTYNLEKFKNEVENSTTYRREFKEYINYLPTYSKNSAKVNNSNYFHVIIEYNKGSEYNYGIMEVHIR